MKKFKTKLFTLLMVSMMLLNITLSVRPVFAAEKTVRINIGNSSDVVKDPNLQKRFLIWKYSDTTEADLQKIVSNLQTLSETKLTERYGQPILTDYTKDGTVEVKLENGLYYVREYVESNTGTYISPFLIQVYDGMELDIYTKSIPMKPGRPPETPPGIPPNVPPRTPHIIFKKIDGDTGEVLMGAKFKVTEFIDGVYVDKEINGEKLVFESGVDGKFIVYGLEDKDYYLWESQAPKGYKALDGSIRFKFDRNIENRTIEIKNYKNPEEPPVVPENPPTPPPVNRIDIPKTGDITLILMSILGLVFISVGFKLTRENN